MLCQNWIVLLEAQAKAVFDALHDWNLDDQVQIMFCDTTASNTGHLNGACVLLEQRLERELLLFACLRLIYELVLRSVFEAKIEQVTNSPDIPLSKQFKDNWSNLNYTNIQIYLAFVKQHYNDCEIDQLVMFYNCELQKKIVRDDYRELIELSIIFLERRQREQNETKASWCNASSAVDGSLKICLLQSHFKISMKEKQALREVYLFIATVYVKPWLGCSLAVRAPYQDLWFLKTLKDYEKVDKVISQSALSLFLPTLVVLVRGTSCI